MTGIACVVDSTCGVGRTCLPAGFGWYGGYCSFLGCTGDADCGTGGACLMSGTNRLCYRRCTLPSDCRAGYICVNALVGTNVCVPGCAMDPATVCGPARCDAMTQQCTPTCVTSAQCSTGSTCLAGRCGCTVTTNCGAGNRCYTATRTCGCANDATCGAGHRCDLATGNCIVM